MKKEHAIIGIVAAAVICFVLGYVLGTANSGGDDAKQGAVKAPVAKVDTPAEGENTPTAGNADRGPDSDMIPVGASPLKGNANAPVTIIEFSEFQCPFCSRVLPSLDQLVKEYPNDVRVVFKHNPLSFHKDAPLASEASLAAGEQGKFWEYHDLLFKNQRALKREDLEKYAQELQLDMAKFKADLDSGKYKKQIADDQALAAKLGARGTPNFFINGVKLVGAKPFEEFKKVVDEELGKVKGKNAGVYAERVKANFKKEEPPKQNNRPPADDNTIYKATVGTSAVKGDKDNAIVTIVEFSEFQCPFCSRVLPTLKQIDEAFPGKVRVAFKHMPLPFHKDAPLASRAALAAGEQGKFWEYHDLLFANQRALKREDLEKYAQQLGLNMAKFKAGLDNEALDKQIEEDKALGAKLGARGTPHFFINGKRLSGAQPFERFKEAVEDAIKRAEPLTAKGLKGDALYDELMKNATAEFKAAAAPSRPDDNKVYEIDSSRAPFKGSDKAVVTIVEFSEFQCPFCSRVLPTLKGLQDKYGDKIKIAFMHQPLPFHQDAPLASEAAMAAHEQGKFWEYHDLLFANQRALKREDLEKYAQQIGLNMAKFKEALDSGKYKDHISKDQAEARKVGASGTPTFFVNGRKLVGAQPQPAFEKLIDEELAKKK